MEIDDKKHIFMKLEFYFASIQYTIIIPERSTSNSHFHKRFSAQISQQFFQIEIVSHVNSIEYLLNCGLHILDQCWLLIRYNEGLDLMLNCQHVLLRFQLTPLELQNLYSFVILFVGRPHHYFARFRSHCYQIGV
jgi:hypothetical protein